MLYMQHPWILKWIWLLLRISYKNLGVFERVHQFMIWRCNAWSLAIVETLNIFCDIVTCHLSQNMLYFCRGNISDDASIVSLFLVYLSFYFPKLFPIMSWYANLNHCDVPYIPLKFVPIILKRYVYLTVVNERLSYLLSFLWLVTRRHISNH